MTDHRLLVPDTLFEQRSEPVGAQVPSNFLAPVCEATAAHEVELLCEAAGLYLLPWQKLVLRNALGEGSTGRLEAFEVGLIVPRQNGKNVVLLARELAGLFILGEEQIVHTSHLFKTTKSAFRDLRAIIERNPFLLRKVKKISESSGNTSIETTTGRIDFVARASGGGRGLSGDLVVLDEAFRLDPVLVSDLLPTLSARPSPQLWYTSSTGFDYSDVLRELRRRALEEPDKEPHLAYFEWETPANVPWDSVEAVQASNPSLGYLQDWSWIQSVDLRGMTEEAYRRERLGQWAETASENVIGSEVWSRSVATDEAVLGRQIVRRSAALEVTRDRDMAFIAGAAEFEDGGILVELLAARDGVAWVQDACADLASRHKFHAGFVMDSLSGGVALAPRLMERNVPVSLATTKDLVSGTARVYDLLCATTPEGDPDPGMIHSSHPLLDDAAYTATRRRVGNHGAWTWGTKSEVKIEPLRAVTLAVRGLDMEPIEKPRKRRVLL